MYTPFCALLCQAGSQTTHCCPALQLDEFVLDLGAIDIGQQLSKLDIGLATKSSVSGALGGLLGQSWALASVEVMHMASGARQVFKFNGWIDKQQRRVQLLPAGVSEQVRQAGCDRAHDSWHHLDAATLM